MAREACQEKKAGDICLLEMEGVSDLADYILIASGSTPPQLKAIQREVEHRLKEKGIPCRYQSGDPECGWIVMDYLSVVIHVLHPQARQYYALEELWAQAPTVH